MFESTNTYAERLRKEHGTALLSKKAAAQELGISTATIDRMRNDGEIKSKVVKGQVKISVVEIAKYVVGGAS